MVLNTSRTSFLKKLKRKKEKFGDKKISPSEPSSQGEMAQKTAQIKQKATNPPPPQKKQTTCFMLYYGLRSS